MCPASTAGDDHPEEDMKKQEFLRRLPAAIGAALVCAAASRRLPGERSVAVELLQYAC